jgi:hypothetical protein
MDNFNFDSAELLSYSIQNVARVELYNAWSGSGLKGVCHQFRIA